MADHVTVEVAGKLAGISSRTLRQWLAPLVERIGELERENGRLEAATATNEATIDELRRRAEQAEAERYRLAAAQAAPAAPRATEAVSATGPSPQPVAGFWGRVRRVFGGGDG